MKLILAVVGLVVILFISFVTWLLYLDTRDLIDSRSPTKLAANSSLIILARIDTNAPPSFIVTEVWKQPAQILAQPVKVGARFPVGWPKDGGPLPDGEVIFYHRDSPIPLIEPKPKLIPWSEYVIWQGRIDDMTVQQFKTACGL